MECQRHLFDISDEQIYLNGAYMSPQLKSVTAVGQQFVALKGQPYDINKSHFFDGPTALKSLFAQLIHCPVQQVAIIPSVSYGIANVVSNINLTAEDEIILLEDQFPSNVYHWQYAAEKVGAKIRFIAPDPDAENRAQSWNQNILSAINTKTKVVAMEQIHWMDGTLFDLVQIREKSAAVGAKLIIDGTQSIGAMPFDVAKVQPDALICAGYKSLMGPYSIGLAYYSPSFNEGSPIEHGWISRKRSDDFTQLTTYETSFRSGADKYSVGETSNFILVPMLAQGIRQLLDWDQSEIQAYANSITEQGIASLRHQGFMIEQDAHRAKHLFGVRIPANKNMQNIKKILTAHQIHVSYRSDVIRVSPGVYNRKSEFDQFVHYMCTETQ